MITPIISIIIPVYNTEKYLCFCVNSILGQTFKDFELLLINDGSTDNSGRICDAYAAKDHRIRVFHVKNGGASAARNIAIDNSRGEWITFVDSDDWIDCFLYERMMNLASLEGSDVVVCGMSLDTDDKCNRIFECPREYASILSLSNLRMIEGPVYSSLCNKLIRREVLINHSIRFDSRLQMWDDLWVMMRIRFYNPQISILNGCYYHYRITNSPSITKSSRSKKIQSQLLCSELLSTFFSDQGASQKHFVLLQWMKFHAVEVLFDDGCYSDWRQLVSGSKSSVWLFKSYYGGLRIIQYLVVIYGGVCGELLLKLYKKIKRLCQK